MNTPAIVTPEPVVTPTPIVESESVAAHGEQFGPSAQPVEVDTERDDAPKERDESGRFRHRSQSQRAKPEDVAEISSLTKTLRELEDELRKSKPDALEGSPRVVTLKQRIRAMKADLDELKPAKVETPKPAEKAAAPTTFDDKEPVLEDFSDTSKHPDPYAALVRAQAAFDRRKEAFEATHKQSVEAEEASRKAEIDAYHGRTAEFAKTHPDFDAVTGPMIQAGLPNLLVAALIKSDKGAESVYHLAQHQDVLDELVLLTEGKPVTDAHVAIVQRRLKQHAQAAQVTGSVAAAQTSYIPPRPPNPVRTGPIKAADDPPGEGASISEHAKYHHKRR